MHCHQMLASGHARSVGFRTCLVLWTVVVTSAGGPVLAQSPCLGFTEERVVDDGTNGVEALHAADLDGDGDLDLITASFGDNKIFWYENDGATPPQFTARLVDDRMFSASDVATGDLDGDGDVDIVGSARRTNRIAWFANNGGSPPSFTAQTISVRAEIALAVHVADVDDDGDLDVLSASFGDDTIAWYENDGSAAPTFTERIISTVADAAASVFAADLDGDGDVDVLSASRLDDTIAWYENMDPAAGADGTCGTPDDNAALFGADGQCGTADDLGRFGDPATNRRVISSIADVADAVYAADLDGDGDLDVLSASAGDNTIGWYENVGPAAGADGTCGTADDNAALFGPDGQCGTTDDLGRFGNPTVNRRVISATAAGATAVSAGDVDGDGDVDVLAASTGNDVVAWYRNDGGAPPSFAEVLISTSSRSPDDVIAADLNGDGHLDVASAASVAGFPATEDRIAWYENDGAAAPAFTERSIFRSADGAEAVVVADLDGDGDLDVASAGRKDKIAWYENVGTLKPAFAERPVSQDARGASAIATADLDGDGDADLVSASVQDDKIAWYENDGATPPAFTEHVISVAADGALAVQVADVDGDGDVDVLSASAADDKIAWYENLGGTPPVFAERIVSTNALGAAAVAAGDVDGDGDLDLLSASIGDDKVAWYENDGATPPSFTEVEVSTMVLGATSVHAADLDGDGDLDILAAAFVANTVLWFENDGATPPTFSERAATTVLNGPTFVSTSDLDADGALDVVVVSLNDANIVWLINDGAAPPTFRPEVIDADADLAQSAAIGDVDGDGDPDVVAGLRLRISWYRSSGEICDTFDASGDGLIDGVELVWLGRAFGASSATPAAEWWFVVDYSRDGQIDGDDLAILASTGVFGLSTSECFFVCTP